MSQQNKLTSNVTTKDIAYLTYQHFPTAKAKVTNFAIKPFSSETLGYLGVHESLTIEVEQESGEKSVLKFFVKSSRPEFNDFQKQAFQVESKFFRDVMPQLSSYHDPSEPCTAKCYLAKSDALFMENLNLSGYKVTRAAFDGIRLKSLMACLARFHASSLLLEEKCGKPLNEVHPRYFEEKVFLKDEVSQKWISVGVEVVKAVAKDLGLKTDRIDEACKSVIKVAERSVDDVNVLCHADLWSHNVLFNERNTSCKLVDFQMVTYRSHAIDLAQALHMNTTVGDRKRLERELIGSYHDVLLKHLRAHNYKGRIVSLDEVCRSVEKKRICGMMLNLLFCPITLLNDRLAAEFSRNIQRYMYVDRTDFVQRALSADRVYRSRVEEAVREFVEMFAAT